MCDHPLVGLVAALLVEARHWTKLRWDFDERAFLRAWHLSVVLILFGAVSVWLDGPSSRRIYSLFAWLPVLLLPVQFVQSFGTRSTVPTHIFSVIAHSRIKREQALGQAVSFPEINFGYVTIVATLLGSSLGRNADAWLFLPGVLAITAWALRSVPTGRAPLLPWLAALLAIAAAGVVGQLGMRQLNEWIASGMGGAGGTSGDPDYMRSRIELGGLRDHKNTSRILWRLRNCTGGAPALLRSASYNTYLGGAWQFRNQPDTPDFESLTIASDRDTRVYRIASDDPSVIRDPAPAGLPSFDLLGAVRRNSLLPMPPGTRSLRDPAADNLEINPLGTMRIEPKHGVIDTRVTWQDHRDLESPPWTSDDAPDLRVPASEREALRQVVAELELDQGDLTDKTSCLRLFFFRHFQYARYLDLETSGPMSMTHHGNNAISRFLLESRRGHCEFFATATTLLLRQAGIPARYTVGFASIEHAGDRAEVVLRGTHAHAWCRAWDAGSQRWVDISPHPTGPRANPEPLARGNSSPIGGNACARISSPGAPAPATPDASTPP